MLIQRMQGFPPGATAPPPRAAAPRTEAETSAAGTRSLVEAKAQAAAAPPPAEEVKAAVVQANQAMAALSASVSFEVDSETRTMVVKVIDTTDNRVLRQIPSQEMLEIARALDRVQGLLVRNKA